MARIMTSQQEDAMYAGAAGVPELFAGAAGVPELFAGAAGFAGYDFKTHKGIKTAGRRKVLEARCANLGICNQTADRERRKLYSEISAEYCALIRTKNSGVGPAGQKNCGGIWPKVHLDAVNTYTDEAWKSGRRAGGSSEGGGNKGLMYAGIGVVAIAVIYFAMKKK